MKRICLVLVLFLGVSTVVALTSPTPIVVILMENRQFSKIVGSPYAPYINTTLIPSGTLATNYFANTHPSLPNYLDLTMGQTDGCTNDACVPDFSAQDNLFAQLEAASLSFASWEESMPSTCDEAYSNGTTYAKKHNPELYFSVDDPVCDLTDTASLPDPLPAFTFITPNLCDDMHGTGSAKLCPDNTAAGLTQAGDTWLSQTVPGLLASGADVIVVWDEGSGSNLNGGGQVAAISVGPAIPVGQDATFYSHFSLLAGIETHFGLPLLGAAQTANVMPV